MLRERLADTTRCAFPRQPRDHHGRVDAFLLASCRHASAVSRVLCVELDKRGEHPLGGQLADASHTLLLSIRRTRGRLCGAAQFSQVHWSTSWRQTVEHFEALAAAEMIAVRRLVAQSSTEDLRDVAARLQQVERSSPTRPHPFLPRRGWTGRAAAAVYTRVDAVWDSFEGRCVPPLPPITGSMPVADVI